MLPKVIFCDLDGPIISTSCYAFSNSASMFRSSMNTNALGFLIRLCRDSGAKLVTNSTHNYHITPTGNLREDMILFGVPQELFHEDWRTIYGFQEHLCDESSKTRMESINYWLKNNGEHSWICFDDYKFTEDSRLILVDFDDGIQYNHYCQALKLFGIEVPRLIF